MRKLLNTGDVAVKHNDVIISRGLQEELILQDKNISDLEDFGHEMSLMFSYLLMFVHAMQGFPNIFVTQTP